jgi:uncharacterized protein YqjF (DUF2071 family)
MGEERLFATAVRQARAVDDVSGRPWPLPEVPWLQAQTRRDVLLAFWPVDHDRLERLLPPELTADDFGGQSWVGVSAYRVTGLRVRGLPAVPGLSTFPQLELFACATADGRPGLWMFSLEIGKPLLAEAAKRVHRLPAYRANVNVEAGVVAAARDGLSFYATYAPDGAAHRPASGTREHFLTERFALYTADGGRLYRAEVHHPPWQLRHAGFTVESASLAPFRPGEATLAFAADEQDVLVWPLEELP